MLNFVVSPFYRGGWTKKAKQKNRDSEDFGKKVDNSRPRLIVFIVGSMR